MCGGSKDPPYGTYETSAEPALRDLERVSVHLHAGAAVDKIDRDNIEPAGRVHEPAARQEIGRHARDSLLFPSGYGRSPAAKLAPLARLHLDEDDIALMAGDDVDLATARPVAARDNCVPAPLQFGAGQILAQFSKCLPAIVAHGRYTAASFDPTSTTKFTRGTKITNHLF